jgi:putative DNA methylase
VTGEEAGGDVPKRKLIEVSLPLEAINREAAREKSIRQRHPSTLHLWWARRPLAAARAVLFAQLVDDPSSRPDLFPTEEDQRVERERLHELIERLVRWENIQDQDLLDEAHEEILKSTDGDPPPILDPFAGGGTIPLEAQRLGLEAHASDLNPVAVLINKALIEIPPKFAGRPPVFPGLAEEKMDWEGASGLAADVKAYGKWMRDEAFGRIGEHYPKAKLEDGTEATVIAWIWARTVTCPNPACEIEMPLVRSWWLSKKKNKEVWIKPEVVDDPSASGGQRVTYAIKHGVDGGPDKETDGTVGRQGAKCVACGTAVPLNYVREEGRAGRIGRHMSAIVADGGRSRLFIPASQEQEDAAEIEINVDGPEGSLPANPRDFKTPNYGLSTWSDLFTKRQLLALTTLCDLVPEARTRVLEDAQASGLDQDEQLEAGGTEAAAYADAVATYLGLGISRLADIGNSLARWENTKTQVRNLFSRQAIPMVWDFAETTPFGQAAGSFEISLGSLTKVIGVYGPVVPVVTQADASRIDARGCVISTDPPYYDNIGYSDLSDFFYVWLRMALGRVYPELLSTMLVPKAEELVANPYRHDGKHGAKEFFEGGFRQVFLRARESALPDFPMTVYYAFKQSESSDGDTASTGWETLLDGMVRSGWKITSTWPMRSELSNRMIGQGTNALASSIALALRPRPVDAPSVDRRGFIAALQEELPDALRELQHGAIAPVDLPQAAIGPGMAVFSRYSKVVEDDGSAMSVRSALARINEVLDQVLNEQEGDFDPPTRFAVSWYRQFGYDPGKFGEADNMARALNTSVDVLARSGVLKSAGGKVSLIAPVFLPDDYDVLLDQDVSVWEVLHHLIARLDRGGVPAAGGFVVNVQERPGEEIDLELVKELAFLLFAIAEQEGRTQDALSFNNVATAWPEIVEASRERETASPVQGELDLEQEN